VACFAYAPRAEALRARARGCIYDERLRALLEALR
jgi:hypothetical protein